ncbi:MAG: YeeE/YedE family protein [Phototrophicales bacterium]|nr:YeeE/YedE family protein [Phototrophicales bacterium]
MTETTVGGGSLDGRAPIPFEISRNGAIRVGIALLVVIGLIIAAHLLYTPDAQRQGMRDSFSLLIGVALGIAMIRGRFCFFCILRDFIEHGNSGGLFSIVTALAVGGIGYAIVFGAQLPNPSRGTASLTAHIGPVSWVLLAAGGAFGIGMALSGACVSGHLYRLGEGYLRAPIALFGTLIGFGVGFFTWQSMYLEAIRPAPVAWLPETIGYGGALTVHLVVLSVIAIFLLRFLPSLPARESGKITVKSLYETVFVQRWNPLFTGALVGMIGTFAYFRVNPLGVTSQISTIARTTLQNGGYLGDRLIGLDTFRGCAALIANTITENGWLVIGLVFGSFAVALMGNKFKLSTLTVRNSTTALLGGILMGWGSMLALGCTVGTLLSGISAFAISGWVFAIATFIGVWVGIKLKLHTL